MSIEVAIIGAGIAGLTCARTLQEAGLEVRIFEKARGPGGRMSTRRADAWRFDHGAQYFTARDPHFQEAVAGWIAAGVVAPWEARIAVLGAAPSTRDTVRYVGRPGMSAICRDLAGDLPLRLATRVASIERSARRWVLVDDAGTGLGTFDAVVVSAPAPQTRALLEPVAPALAAQAATVAMAPCWAVMAVFAEAPDVPFDGAFVHDAPLSWVARNGSKPGRPSGEAWVLHGSPAWSASNLERSSEDVAAELLAAFDEACGTRLPPPVHTAAHRWAYALPRDPLPDTALFDAELRIVACGDWCAGPRVEGAFLSGLAAAKRLLAP